MSRLIRASSLQGIDHLIAELGGDFAAIMQQCAINVDFNKLEQETLTYRAYAQLLEHCANTLNCPNFGLKLASLQSFDILGHIAIAAQTGTNLAEGLDWVIKYLHLHTPALNLTTLPLDDNEHVFLSFAINLRPLPAINQVIELTIALAIATLKNMSNGRCKPQSVFLPHTLGANKQTYHQHFGCKVITHRNSAGVLIAKQDLALTLNVTKQHKTQAALNFLAENNAYGQSLPDQVSALTRIMLPIFQSANNTIAAALNIHPRTLHRELKKHDTSFVKLKDATRRALCEHYLLQNQLSVTQISELLGYQEQATLCTSIKRWFNCSARAFRAKHC